MYPRSAKSGTLSVHQARGKPREDDRHIISGIIHILPAITRPLVLGSSSLQPPARVPRAKYRTPPASVARRRPRHQTASQGGRQRVPKLASFPRECHGGVDVKFLAARQSRPCFF